MDNEVDPEGKKAALKAILADYNARYGSNHRISEFDHYYQDVQKRIKDQQWPNSDFPAAHKIDITLVVDMLLTGFDFGSWTRRPWSSRNWKPPCKNWTASCNHRV